MFENVRKYDTKVEVSIQTVKVRPLHARPPIVRGLGPLCGVSIALPEPPARSGEHMALIVCLTFSRENLGRFSRPGREEVGPLDGFDYWRRLFLFPQGHPGELADALASFRLRDF